MVSSIQRSLNTLQYYTGIQNGVLITEVSTFQRFVIERFHCTIKIGTIGVGTSTNFSKSDTADLKPWTIQLCGWCWIKAVYVVPAISHSRCVDVRKDPDILNTYYILVLMHPSVPVV